jgi:alkylation response protein AidB-like acyl-CoA dehydrogenase
MPSPLLEAARSLAPLFESEAAAAESAGELTPSTVAALHEAGLFALMVPSSLGGAEADAVTALEVLTEVCRADGSTGWALLANVTSTAFAAAYCGESAVKEMFTTGTRPAVHAGQFAPRGTAEPVAGGYRVAGRYSFASGSSHAGYLAAGALCGDQMLAYYVPKELAVILGNWDVMGLAGTASVDYEIPEQVIDADWTFSLLSAEPLRGGPVYRLGVLSLTSIGHAAFALGVGQRAMEEITAIAGGKARLGAVPVRDQQLFQHDYAMHDAAMQAARSWTFDVFGQAQAAVDAGSMPDAVLANRLRQATTWSTRVAADAVRFAYTWSGSDGLRNPSVLGRCFRDMHAGTQHLFVDNNTLTQAAQALLGGS